MTRLSYRATKPPKRHWWDGWAPALFLFVLVGCLVYATGLTHWRYATVVHLRGQLAIQTALADHGSREVDRLQAEIDRLVAITPTERIVVEPCVPQRHERKRDVPVFSRDSQFIGVSR